MMNLAFLDANFELIGYFQYTNLQWNRKYYEPGSFMAEIPEAEYITGAKYVFCKDRPELGMIQKEEFGNSIKGKVILLSGYFYEFKLNDKITYPRFNGDGKAEEVAREIVTIFKNDIPRLVFAPQNDPPLGEEIVKETTGDGLAKVVYELLKPYELSCKCAYDFANNQILFSIWQGKDRTQGQEENSFATFSTAIGNIRDLRIIFDDSNYKNYVVVVGNGRYEDGKQITVEVDARKDTSVYKKILYVDATGTIFNPDKETEEVYRAGLKQQGVEALQKTMEITNISFSTIQTKGLRYMEDYDLGDKCDIVLPAFGLTYASRLTAVTEVLKNSTHSVTLSFGEKIPVAYRR